MSEELSATIEKLGPMAEKVGELADEQTAAYNEASQAETELLETVLTKIKPALRAISSRIQSSYRSFWPDNTRPEEVNKYFRGRGVRVYGDGAELDYPRSNGGEYNGEDLYLLSDGTWLEIKYSGRWSRWQGSSSEWDTKTKVLTTAQVTDDYDVDDIIEKLSEALEKQLEGKREKATARAQKRATTIRALTTLMKK